MDTRRLFFALWPDVEVATRLIPWAQTAQRLCGGRVMRVDTLHLTLVFLGSVPVDRLPSLCQVLAHVPCAGGDLTLDRFGRFRGPRIVWAGSTQPADWLVTLQAWLVGTLVDRGLMTPASEPFRAHVSLLRHAGDGDVRGLAVPEPIVWHANRMVLAASAPRASGAHYEPLAQTILR